MNLVKVTKLYVLANNYSDDRKNGNSEWRVADDSNRQASKAKAMNNKVGIILYLNGRDKNRKLQVRSKPPIANNCMIELRTSYCLFTEARY